MGLTDEMIGDDVSAIFADLAGSSAVEEVERIPAGETAVSGSFDILRARQRTSEELLPTGFSTEYHFSFYAQRADIGVAAKGDVLVMANGDRVRILRMEEQPARVVVMFDVGDEFADGDN